MKSNISLIKSACLLTLLLISACSGGSSTPMLGVFAGNMGSLGSVDGAGAQANFASPFGVATDGAGNVYVADSGNHNIRKITPTGVVTTLAGTTGVAGSADGIGGGASFSSPASVATDSSGNVYVADKGNNTIRKITSAGVVSTLAGMAGVAGSADGSGAAARFSFPTSIATDSAGYLYVADLGNNTIRKVSPDGVVSTLAGTAGVIGSADGSGASASFNQPMGVTTDNVGNIYVADASNHVIRKITPAGVVTTFAGTAGVIGNADGTGAAASFTFPTGVAADSLGNVYVAVNGSIRKITSASVVNTLAGTSGVVGSSDGIGAAASFYGPWGIATDSTGNVFVADSNNHTIRLVTQAGAVNTFAGNPPLVGSADGLGASASFNNPFGIATDSAGNIYIADSGNNTIRKITPASLVTTVAGTASVTGSADGAGASASFIGPRGVATDSAGNIYVADTVNNIIRKITRGGVVTTLAGSLYSNAQGYYSCDDGTGANARFGLPYGVAADSAGNIYVADTGNHMIRKITPDGVVTRLAGTAAIPSSGTHFNLVGQPGSADGVGPAASFRAPSGIATDSSGNVYVADQGNSTIRKITPAGVVTTLAGVAGAIGSANGIGGLARFNNPSSVATDALGNVYVADNGNNTVRKITPAGGVSTVVGVPGKVGFISGPLPGGLAGANGLAIRGTSLYITTENGVAIVNRIH